MDPSLGSPPPRLRRRATAPLRVCRPSPSRRRTSLASRLSRLTNNTSLRCSSYNLLVQKIEWNRDLTDDILSLLSLKSLTRFKCVSKDWQTNISSPLFFKAQLQKRGLKFTGFIVQDKEFSTNRYIPLETSGGNVQPLLFSFLPKDVIILASCNGLICCRSSSPESAVYVCNPVNKQFIEIKMSSLGTYGYEISIALAFDFDGSYVETFAKFKLVKVVQNCGLLSNSHIAFELYSSETGIWRMSNATCYEGAPIFFKHRGIYIRGVLYWLTHDQTILVFDVEKEMARLISCPHICGTNTPDQIIGESEGSLHYVLITGNLSLCVWCLENYSNERWTLKYCMSFKEIRRLFPNLNGWLPFLVPLAFKDSVLLLKVLTDIIVFDMKNNKVSRACSSRDLNLQSTCLLRLSASIFPFHELGSCK